MAKVVSLSDSKIKGLKPDKKQYKVADGDGLYLHVMPSGAKIWKVRYKLFGKQSQISIGKYPEVGLASARARSLKIREQVVSGKKPTTNKVVSQDSMTFSELVKEYFDHRDDLSTNYVKNNRSYLENYYYPTLEHMPVSVIEPGHIVEIVKFMNKKGVKETIRRTASLMNRIFRYGTTLQYMKRNPMSDIDISVIVSPIKRKNFAHITDENEFRKLLIIIDGYVGDLYTKTALQLMPYVFVRPQNIRSAKWSEFDFKKKIWSIPGDKMKMDRDHLVPLTDSMINIIRTVEGNGSEYLFPSPYSKSRQLSENTLNVALQRMGYKDIMTAHGFRHSASTFLNENAHKHGVSSDVIEIQMAHVEKNAVKGTYNKAIYIEERKRLMRWWSGYIDLLKL